MSLAALKKIAEAKASKGGSYLRDGRYRLLIKEVICDTKTDGDFFIVEFEVATAAAIEPGVEPNPVGSTCSVAWNLTKHKSAVGNAKSFVLGVLGGDEATTTTEDFFKTLQEVVGSSQPLRGYYVDDETYRKPIKSGANAGKPITLHRWTEVPNQAPADIKKRREAIEASGE